MRLNIDSYQFLMDEPLGKQKKEWILFNGQKYLFKKSSIKDDGSFIYNDISECIACDIGKILGINIAEYQLCTRNGQNGIITKDFLNNEQKQIKRFELIDGVSLIQKNDPDFNNMELINRKNHQLYTVSVVLDSVEKYGLRKDALTMIIYDSLIANQDRNPSNYGIINDLMTNSYTFAPLFDNCTCLGISMNSKRLRECVDPMTYEIKIPTATKYANEFIVGKVTLERSLQYKEKKEWDKVQIDRIINLIEEEKRELTPLLLNGKLSKTNYHKILKKIEKKYIKYDVTKLQYQPLISYLTTFYPDEICEIIDKIKEEINSDNINSIFKKYEDELPTDRIEFAKLVLIERANWICDYYYKNKEMNRGKIL